MSYVPRTMRRGSFALTGIRFDPSEAEAAAAAEAERAKAAEVAAAEAAAKEKTHSQADVDRIVGERLARDRKDRPSDDEIKALRESQQRLAEIEASNKTELEKANERATKAEADRQSALDTANKRLIEAAVLSQATAQNALKPEHMHKLIDTGQVTVGDDGQVTGAEEAVKAFLEANPEYVGTTRANGDADQGARGTGAEQLTRDALKSMSPEQIETALAEGRLNTVIGAR